MILELLINILVALIVFIGGLFGEWALPDWFTSMRNGIGYLAELAGTVGNWVPMGDAIQALYFVMAMLGLGLAIKVVRIVASFFTAGGGAAG